MGCVEYWMGYHAPHTHSRCSRTRTALARSNAYDTVVADCDEAGNAVWEGSPAGWGGWPGGGGQGGVAGRVGLLAGWDGGPGRVAGLVGLRAGSGCGPGGGRGGVG